MPCLSLSCFVTVLSFLFFFFFFFNDTATTEIYTLSLHDALPISGSLARARGALLWSCVVLGLAASSGADRKSTRLNSSHSQISYAVFCLKKKKKNKNIHLHNRYTVVFYSHIITYDFHLLTYIDDF